MRTNARAALQSIEKIEASTRRLCTLLELSTSEADPLVARTRKIRARAQFASVVRSYRRLCTLSNEGEPAFREAGRGLEIEFERLRPLLGLA